MPDRERFVRTIGERAGLDSPDAATRAADDVLRALGGQLTAGAADRLAESLPPEGAVPLRHGAAADTPGGRQGAGASMDEFLRDVARRGGEEVGDAATRAQAVLRAVAETADPGAVAAVREQLTAELRGLLAAEHDEQDFRTVTERAGRETAGG